MHLADGIRFVIEQRNDPVLVFLGQVESIGPTLFLDGIGVPSPNQLKDVIAFTMLVMILVFRPSGILGERVARSRA